MPSNSQQAHCCLQQTSRRAGFYHSDNKNEKNKKKKEAEEEQRFPQLVFFLPLFISFILFIWYKGSVFLGGSVVSLEEVIHALECFVEEGKHILHKLPVGRGAESAPQPC